MEEFYPAGPINVPSDLTAPSARYRRQAWLATCGLLFFIATYLALGSWLAWTCFRLLSAAVHSPEGAGNVFMGLGAGFLSIFLFKALFFIKRGQTGDDLEITISEQPQLFAFINTLADEIGAPRPFRVYLSGRVNACVFFDLSPLNLILPSKKNLEIGLGLVNVLNLGEFKAVLAHEFGHFAQRTMAVGRWIYVSQQIAAHIVGKRDGFDKFLNGLSRLDIRIAWIGWLFRIIIWSIRSIVELMFTGVILAEKALSREMEFQADLVSVSVCGSDALINALHKLSAADDAWARAIAFCMQEKAAGRCTNDVFRLQERILERMRSLLNDPTYGIAPPSSLQDGSSHRVFKSSLAMSPQMWSTHPANADREENAKRRYVSALIDPRSAWVAFKNSDSIKALMSRRILGNHDGPITPINELIDRLDQQYRPTCLNPAYRGVYLARSTVRHVNNLADLYVSELSAAIAPARDLYPESLTQDVEARRALEEESVLLRGLLEGSLKASGEAIRYRGREIPRRELTPLLKSVDAELAAVNARIWQNDRLCRTSHIACARKLGLGWEPYIRGLLAVHHYATHAEAILRDVKLYYKRQLHSELTKTGLRKPNLNVVQTAADIAYRALARTHSEAKQVSLDTALLARLSISSWAMHMQELKFPAPTKETLASWVNNFDGWIDSAISKLANLRFVSLEQLLESEALLAQKVGEESQITNAQAASVLPASYPTLLPGAEISKPRARTLIQRFLGGDSVIAKAVRLCTAAAIIGAVILSASGAGHATVMVYNALGRPVQIAMGTVSVTIPAFGHQKVQIDDVESLHVRAMTMDGRIVDDFDAKVPGRGAHIIYNVASAGVLVAWTAIYGNAQKVPAQVLGSPHWIAVHASAEFEDPPKSISTKSGGGTRSVLTGLGSEPPAQVLGPIGNDRAAVIRIIQTHAQWDEPSTLHYQQWIQLSQRIT